MTKGFSGQASSLEAAFFLNQDAILIENLRKLEQRKRTKAELAAISGIHDDHLLTKLLELEVAPQDLAAISLVPLVCVAWADGIVDNKERTAVMLAAEKMGFAKDCECYAILNDWCTHKPDYKLLESWSHYVKALVKAMPKQDVASLKREILEHADMVAGASGGVFGFGKVSAKEKALLEQLSNVFEV
jgi:hypothetical protein